MGFGEWNIAKVAFEYIIIIPANFQQDPYSICLKGGHALLEELSCSRSCAR